MRAGIFADTAAGQGVELVLMVGAVLAGFGVLALLFWAVIWSGRASQARQVQPESPVDDGGFPAEEHDKAEGLAVLQVLLNAEPQLLLELKPTGRGRLIVNSLGAEAGLPETVEAVLDLPSWCSPEAADELQPDIAVLIENGTAFRRVVSGGVQGGGCSARPVIFVVEGLTGSGSVFLRIRLKQEGAQELNAALVARDQARRSVAAMRSLLDVLPMPVWLCHDSGGIAWANAAYVRAVEAQSLDEVCREQIAFLEEEQRQRVAEAIETGRIFQDKLRVTVHGGERRTFDTIAVPSPGGGNATIAVDVEAIETARGALDRHMAAHARVLDRVTTAVAIFDADQRLVFFNQHYADLWGLEPQWLETRPKHGEILDRLRARSVLPEQSDYNKWKQQLLNYDGAESELERWWHLPDGRTIFVIVEYTEDGSVTFLYENVTEQVALQSGYNELVNVQRETLDHLRDGVAVFAASGRLRLANSAFTKMWQLPASLQEEQPHIEQLIEACSKLHADEATWNSIKMAVTAIEDQRQSFSGQMNRRDGVILAYTGVPLPDGAMMLTMADVTDRELAERALREKNEALETANTIKSNFISNVSYELRTPLTNIIGFSDMLMNPALGELTDKQREYLQDIRSSSATLLAIISDILDLATLDAGAMELNLGPVRARSVVEAAVLGVRERLMREQITLKIDIEPEDLEFIADSQRITQVLYNLLSNAIGFSPSGGEIQVNCRRQGGIVKLAVIDHGRGIPEDYRKAVFDRFESDSRGTRHRGAGLGLSIVRDLVELHGGRVELYSSEGKGTAVIISLPEDGRQKQDDEAADLLRLEKAGHGEGASKTAAADDALSA